MPFQLEITRDMEEYEQEVSVVDVYDIASEIGKEFEKIIDAHGTEAVTSLMPKVINALEHLEGLATKNERENTTVQELKSRIAQLENDKVEKAEDRQRFEKELEQIEEHWRQESHDLVAMVTRLQEENRKLSSSLAEREDHLPDGAAEVTSPEVEVAVLQRLRNLIDQQRDQIRARDRELSAKSAEVDNLSAQVERLTMIGKELRRKHRGSQSQVRGLLDERADFLAQLQDQHRELLGLKQRLGLAQKENEDLAKSHSEVPDLTNKAVYDLEDPNRPRFTTAELKEILHERNELKARVSDLEDELEMYRPKSSESRHNVSLSRWSHAQRNFGARRAAAMAVVFPSPSVPSPGRPPPTSADSAVASPSWRKSDSAPRNLPNSEEDDPPVQGPLPFEPDDAPWKKSESGIRKLFTILTAFSQNLLSPTEPNVV
ncbi:RILP-like protein homolog isoform X2 [Cryptotermes secundus]|uniref:RILP-like protein homolog isoform X2 n=1 Tax=Cryptotermes secundus TaxID=105785 RepID=UPI000CD7D4E5|nr:RILP-like protein homolog isoform X2 [Cryptotermes secundus]XP_033610527.1 RILP-like protein homolog isoform X2 [Cryptotermes secundus]